jgi:hypothetical protein
MSGKKLYNTGHINVDDEHNSFLNEKHKLYSPNIILVMKSRRIRVTGRVARMGNRRGRYRVLVGRSGVNTPSATPKRRRIILK